MKSKIFTILICGMILIGVCGCNKSSKNQKDQNQEKISMTEEEQIWDDSSADEIYNKRIFLYDQYSEFNGGSDFDFKNDVEFLNTIKDKNKFANKFLKLLNETNIMNILDNGTKIEQYILFSYLSVKVNRCEGLCDHNSEISNYARYMDDYTIGKIYYKDTSFDSNLNPIFKTDFSWPCFIFEFHNEKKGNEYIIISSFDDKKLADNFYILDSSKTTLDEAKNYAHKKWVEIYNESSRYKYEFNWVELNCEIVDKVINNNKEFLDFYIDYKKNVFFTKYDVENPSENDSKSDSNYEPSIGMTAEQVENSTWGSPKKKNKDTYSWGTTEQWVYSKGYIYFRNGRVSSISER